MELGFLARLGASIVQALKAAIAIVLLFALLIMMVKWLADHPAQRAAVGNKIGETAVAIVVGACDLIVAGINAIGS